MPKPTIAQVRALAAALDAQHPDPEPERIAADLSAWVEAIDGVPLDAWTQSAIAREVRWTRRTADRDRARVDG